MLDQDMQCTDFNDLADRCERTARLLDLASDSFTRCGWRTASRYIRLASCRGGEALRRLVPTNDTEATLLMARTHSLARALRRDAAEWRAIAHEEALRAMH